MSFLDGSVVKNPPSNAAGTGDAGLKHGLGRFLEEENGSSLQYSCLENSMDRGAWWAIDSGVSKRQTGVSD